jgi:hypothetical protein
MPVTDAAASLLARVKAGTVGDPAAELRPLNESVRDAVRSRSDATA